MERKFFTYRGSMKDKKTKIEEAKTRQEEYDNLTVKQKIKNLDKKFGVRLGAKKERERLQKKMEQTKQEVKIVKEKKISKKK